MPDSIVAADKKMIALEAYDLKKTYRQVARVLKQCAESP